MGLFDMFGGPKHPVLDPGTPAAAALEANASLLGELADQVGGGFEVVPAEDGAMYVFIGSPPKAFGVAWLSEGEQHNLKKLAERLGLGFNSVADLTERLGAAYSAHKDEPRFSATVGKHRFTVTQSEALGREVAAIIASVEP
ncbi:MAG: hypothetical protein C0418_03810 [Coriobacteriaceae bacterium]|nr:hypothetical protein [Coriobacteriaceae bacterium]